LSTRATTTDQKSNQLIPDNGERAVLVHLNLPSCFEAEDLQELALLAESAGAFVVDTLVSNRKKPDAATFIGKGKAEELAAIVQEQNIELLLFNHDLSPGQERNLELAIKCRVLDRTGLILDIFAQRARSHEGKLQVELAQLEHLSTRLVRGWTHLERQKGGIGLRGPGETQLETDRRLLRERIKTLHQRLKKVARQRQNRRANRKKVPIPTLSFVGYTNAGKSSIFNRLTTSRVYVADQLFATLDPTMRRVELAGNTRVILADTVGFISNLPHDLIEAFKSTLEEVEQSELLIHVVDDNNPDALEQTNQVNEVLLELGAERIPQILIFNKIDLSGHPPRVEYSENGRLTRVWLSAETGEGIDYLMDALARHFRLSRKTIILDILPRFGGLRAKIYEYLEVISEMAMAEGVCRLTISLDDRQMAWLAKQKDFHQQSLQQAAMNDLAPTGSTP
jgi:GTP-binding protein HflX